MGVFKEPGLAWPEDRLFCCKFLLFLGSQLQNFWAAATGQLLQLGPRYLSRSFPFSALLCCINMVIIRCYPFAFASNVASTLSGLLFIIIYVPGGRWEVADWGVALWHSQVFSFRCAQLHSYY